MFFLVLMCATAAMAAPQWYAGPHAGYAHSPGAPLGPDGRVVDTPEVAQAKAAHLAALADASARVGKGPGPVVPGAYGHNGPAYAPSYVPHYTGPPAPLGPDGRVVDTPEVQKAKALHFSLYNAASQHAPAGPVPGPAPWDAPWNSHNNYDDGSYKENSEHWNGGWNPADNY